MVDDDENRVLNAIRSLRKSASVFAAKSDNKNNSKWIPLWMHLMDTVYTMDYLQNSWISSAFDGYDICADEIKRVGIFAAAVHDLGKVTPAFQSVIANNIHNCTAEISAEGFDISMHFTENERVCYGHHSVAGALLAEHFGLCKEVAVVIAAHHGLFPEKGYTDEDSSNLAQHKDLFWDKNNKNSWNEVQKAYLKFALTIAGFSEVGELPKINKETQILLTGLLITADWLASNTEYFPLVEVSQSRDELFELYPKRGQDGVHKIEFPQKWEPDDRWKKTDLIRETFGFSPNATQEKVCRIVESIEKPELVIIEAPMGNGKTEAGLAAAEILAQKTKKSGLAFFLPSQATSNALFTRLGEWAEKQTNGNKLALQLAHGSFLLNKEFELLYSGESDGNPDLIAHQFFCGSKSFLLANFVVGTIDQLLMAAVQQKHVMLKHLGLSDKVVIIDECHAYDAYMNTYLDRILMYLHRYGVPVIILSATLPSKRRMELLKGYGSADFDVGQHPLRSEMSYPLISWTDRNRIDYESVAVDKSKDKQVVIENISQNQILDIIKKCHEEGACIGVIVNTVTKAQKLASRINAFASEKVVLYHAQFLLPDRNKKEKDILRSVGKNSTAEERKGVIVIGTQVLEQSLDIDFDVLITELCPMDLLLQRIGRLHRHSGRKRPMGYEQAKCYVVGADMNELDEGSKAIYGEYLLKKTIKLLPKDLTLPEDISILVQKVYDEQNIDSDLTEIYTQFIVKCEDQKQRATGLLLGPITYGRKASKTIEGLSGNAVSEDSARASVRDGDPSIEVIIVRENSTHKFSILSGDEIELIFDGTSVPDTNSAKEIAGQKLRLPYRLSNVNNGPQILNALREESDDKMKVLQKSPWLHNELFLILNENSEKCLLERYQVKYSYEYGLEVTEGGK